ncbi:molybdopterin molybdotransferase MoeA [Thalassospiraceae bacterium LMO-JJ14]|nr:molybdopterin molybdotransferase MoeA [Thalassospiraceae bacterium LMO-JJ14]
MLSIEEALDKIRAGISPLGTEEIFITDGLGRVLAEDVIATVSHPPQAVSAMDGYAVRAEDAASVPVALTQIGEAAAGHTFEGKIGAGECARIFTGGGLPEGADSIVIQEDTDTDGSAVIVKQAAVLGEWVRPEGLDFAAGKVLLSAGRVLTARDIGLAAAAGATWIRVRRKPRIAVLSTGDEIVMPGAPRRPDQIVSSNSVALVAYAEVLGAEGVSIGIAEDRPDSLRERLRDAAGFDILVTSGGASVGDHDLVQSVFGDEGLELGFYKIAMRPGKPLIFGRIGETYLLGLPGNPVSTGVTAAIFLKAAVECMLGIAAAPLYQAARLGRDLKANGKRLDFMRASLAPSDCDLPTATPFERQDSSMMALFADADCLVMREIGAPEAKAGDIVKIVPLGFSLTKF